MWKWSWAAPHWTEAAADTEQAILWKERSHWDVLANHTGAGSPHVDKDLQRRQRCYPCGSLSVTWRGHNSLFFEAVQCSLVNSSCAWRGDPWSSTPGSSIMFWALQGVTARSIIIFQIVHTLSEDPSPVLSSVLSSAGLSQTKEKSGSFKGQKDAVCLRWCRLGLQSRNWIFCRLTSSTGAGEEQALRTQEKKNTQYGKMPTAWLSTETVKQLSVGFLEGGWEMQRCGNRESSSRRCPTGRERRPALGDTIWSFVRSASCLVGIKDRRKPVCEIMVVTEQHLPVSGLFHRVGLIHLLSA